jgi:VanZ family protein
LRRGLEHEPLTVLTLAVVIAVLLWSVSPFDLSVDVDDLKASIKRLRPVPFGPPIQGETPPLRPGKQVATVLAWVLIGGVIASAIRAKRSRGAPVATAATAAVLVLAIMSEGVQLFVRGRAVDATTILLATLGGALGAGVAGNIDRSLRQLLAPAIAVWLGAVLASGLEPWRFVELGKGTFRGHHFLPFLHYFVRTNVYALADASMQVLLYSPVGALLVARDRSVTPVRAGLAGAVVGALVESGQFLLPTRVPDTTDVILGGVGASFGAWVWHRVHSRTPI